jgi:dTDP-4-dehydrorhamnose 3,5-epimerase
MPTSLEIQALPLEGLKLIKPKVFFDDRGFFLERFQKATYEKLNLGEFVQDNHSFSIKNTLRGLHFQEGRKQGKLISVIEGKIFDVAVDIRPESKTFKQWFGIVLDAKAFEQFWIPGGFAHGFYILSKSAHVFYKVTHPYIEEKEKGFLWDDPLLQIQWPCKQKPLLSLRDEKNPAFHELNSRVFL